MLGNPSRTKPVEAQPGDLLLYWHDTGAFGVSPIYVKVLRRGKVKLYVRDEFGNQRWKYPHFFDRILSIIEVDELRQEYAGKPLYQNLFT